MTGQLFILIMFIKRVFKLNLQFYVIGVLFFLPINIVAQSQVKKTTFLSFDNKSVRPNDYSDAILVISIINIDDSDEIEKLNKLSEKYVNTTVNFVVVTDNNKADTDYLKQILPNYIRLTEEENENIFNRYQTGMFKIFPIHIVLNANGKLIYKKKRTTKNIEKRLEKRIDALLNNKQVKYLNTPLVTWNDFLLSIKR